MRLKATWLVPLLVACSSQSTTTAGGGQGGAAGSAGLAGAGGGHDGGGGTSSGGSSGAPSGGQGSSATGGTAGSAGADGGVVPACAPEAAITKLALSKLTWTWQSYSDQKVWPNHPNPPPSCIACAGTPCASDCTVVADSITWAPSSWEMHSIWSCKPLINSGTCGQEIQCKATFTGNFTPRAKPVATATGWKLTAIQPKANSYLGNAVYSGTACASWADPQVVWPSVQSGLVAAFEGREFPCP